MKQGKQTLLPCLACWLVCGLVAGCHSWPAFTDDAVYRGIEREADRNSTDLAVTGAAIAADTDRIEGHAVRVVSELDGLEAAIDGSSLGDAEKGPLLLRAAMAQAEAAAMADDAAALRKDAALLNGQLAEEREINTALSQEHDRREAAAAEIKEDLAVAREKLAKVSGQRNLAVVIAAVLALAIIGHIVIRVLRFLRVIPV
jgi:hypothetical protein